ncbi:hypothetical protein STSO111631_19570 [Stackebrandtia soli]
MSVRSHRKPFSIPFGDGFTVQLMRHTTYHQFVPPMGRTRDVRDVPFRTPTDVGAHQPLRPVYLQHWIDLAVMRDRRGLPAR